jgi:hypothetical protein
MKNSHLNRILLTVAVSIWLVILLFRFTEYADASVSIITLIVGLAALLFPSVGNIHQSPWFQSSIVTFILSVLLTTGFFFGFPGILTGFREDPVTPLQISQRDDDTSVVETADALRTQVALLSTTNDALRNDTERQNLRQTITTQNTAIAIQQNELADSLSQVPPITQVAVTEVAITAVTVVAPTIQPTPTADPVILFEDNFDDNRNGWDLEGPVRLSQGKLAVTFDYGSEPRWVVIPGLEVDGDFYLQAELGYDGSTCDAQMGFALGEKHVKNHRFMMYHNCGLSPSGKVIFYDNEEELFNTPFDNFRLMVGDYVVAIELLNGMYTLYINDIPTDSAPVDTYGSDIGFFL